MTVAWNPLGHGRDLLSEPVLAVLAARYSKTPAQIVLRWQVELGVAALPRSSNPARLAQNLDIFDFALAADKIAAIVSARQRGEKRVASDTIGH